MAVKILLEHGANPNTHAYSPFNNDSALQEAFSICTYNKILEWYSKIYT